MGKGTMRGYQKGRRERIMGGKRDGDDKKG